MNLPFRLAMRYIVKRRSGTLVHVISGISVAVIAVVTASMICIMSAFNGLEDLVKDLFGTLDADVALVPDKGAVIPQAWGESLNGVPGVASWAPVLEDEVVVRAGDNVRVASILGVDDSYLGVSKISRAIFSGAYLVGDTTSAFTCACLGRGVSDELGIKGDDQEPAIFSISAPMRGKKLSRHREKAFKTIELHACGAFTINSELDPRYLIVPLEASQELLNRQGDVTRFEIRADEGWDQQELAASIQQELASRLGENAERATVLTRDEKHKLVTQTNQTEKWVTFAILSFILVVAAFNIMASLTMLLLDKKEDLEVLHAMGMSPRAMESTFGLQGLAINFIGGLVGIGIGSLLVLGQARYGWLKLEQSVVPSYPVRLDYRDILGIFGVVMVIGGLGSSAMVRRLIRRQTKR